MKYFGALFIAVLLVVSACDDDNDSMETVEPIAMKGFFSSINEDNMDDCQDEELDLYVDEEDGSVVTANIRAGI